MFDIFVGRNFVDSESRVQVVVMFGNNDVFVSLQMFVGIFFNFYLYDNSVVWCEVRKGFVQMGNFFVFQLFNQIYVRFLNL